MSVQTIIPSAQPDITKPLLRALAGQTCAMPPMWLMRQAGRYLPEYRDVRAQAGGFLNLVYDPVKAAEVTVQPIRRYGMDGAILFSDILVIPQALGQHLEFREGDGPRLTPITSGKDLDRLSFEGIETTLSPIYETIRTIRSQLVREGFNTTTLIGFAGAPWTIACYMIDGGGSKDFSKTKEFARTNAQDFDRLIEIIVAATSAYLIKQIENGAEAVQLFDSWAGLCDDDLFHRFVIAPMKKIVQSVRAVYPATPIIGFPRMAGSFLLDYVRETGVQCVGLDQTVSPEWAAREIQPACAVQGNLAPEILLQGGKAMGEAVNAITGHLAGGPFVFNLGHGIIKETSPSHVDDLVRLVRG